MRNQAPKFPLAATMLAVVLAPVSYAQNVQVAVDNPAAKVRVSTTSMNTKMPAQPTISPELAAAIKATMPTQTMQPPAAKASINVTANTNLEAEGTAELEQATSDAAMDAAEAQAEAQAETQMPGAMLNATTVQVDARNPMAPKVQVVTPDTNVRVDASQTGRADVKVTTSDPQPPAAPLAVDATTFAKLQAMIPTAKSMVSGSDFVVQAPTFLLRVPVSRTDAFNELHLDSENATSAPTNVSEDMQTNTPAAVSRLSTMKALRRLFLV
jgi:hypothetical protein